MQTVCKSDVSKSKGLGVLVAMVFADMIGQRSGGSRSASGVQLGTGRGTLRLRSKGPATVEQLVSRP